MDGIERRLEVPFAQERLEYAVRCYDRGERRRGKGKLAYVGADKLNSSGVPSAVETPASARQHWRRAIDTDNSNTGASERQRNAPGAASQLENVTGSIERESPPEWNVTSAERTRVLPIVKRRVVVPPPPAFHLNDSRYSELGVGEAKPR
jgi:hypothetical protein